jgi:hypothetical protein
VVGAVAPNDLTAVSPIAGIELINGRAPGVVLGIGYRFVNGAACWTVVDCAKDQTRSVESARRDQTIRTNILARNAVYGVGE